MTESQTSNTLHNTANRLSNDVIDVHKLLEILFDNRWMILIISLFFLAMGTAYSILATPIYKADALIQVETKNSGVSGISDIDDVLTQEPSAITEIQIIKSRMIIGQTVDRLNLTTVVKADYLPLVGKGMARLKHDENQLSFSIYEPPTRFVNQAIILKVVDQSQKKFLLMDKEDKVLLTGKVNELIEKNGFKLRVDKLISKDNHRFVISKIKRLEAIQFIKSHLTVSELAKQSGILQLTILGEDKQQIASILNDIANNFYLQNVDRNSAEAAKSLAFLKNHLPTIKDKLTLSEEALNAYRLENEAIDLSLEAKGTLDVIVSLDQQLNELNFQETEILQKFTKSHPQYLSLFEKRKVLENEKKRMNNKIETLPQTQQDILRLKRNVEVNQQIYLQLLNKVQELNIIKASTVGNVRIIDKAQTLPFAVKPKKFLIITIATSMGFLLSLSIAILSSVLRRGISESSEFDKIGLPVYACVPLSEVQEENDRINAFKTETSINNTLLTISNPSDLSVESFRSLRTALHFSTDKAKNNIIMITGPSPEIGKSFVSGNLAAVLAKSGQKILLIDADMRKGRLEKVLSIKNGVGLSEYLADQKNITSVINQTDVENLDFICRGKVQPNPSELLLSDKFTHLIAWIKKHYDVVIIDTPPILAVTDASIIGQHVGRTLLISRFRKSTLKEMNIAKERLIHNGIHVSGVIFNAISRKESSDYGYSYVDDAQIIK